MLVSYYLPGNRSAPPPTHLVHGPTGHTAEEQPHFDPSRMAGGRAEEQKDRDQNHYKLYNAFGLCLIAPPPAHQPYERGQKEAAPPPYGWWARVPGGWAEEQTYFLVGNN